MKLKSPKILFEWANDIFDDELYSLSIMDDKTIISASGRYAHGSGCIIVSWREFRDGKINDIVTKTMGKNVLKEVMVKLDSIT